MSSEHAEAADPGRAAFAAFDAAAPAVNPPGQETPAPAPAPIDHAAYARHGVDALCSIFIRDNRPRLAKVWDEKRRADVAQSLAPILAKYGDQLGPWLARWGDWIGVALVVGPAVIDSIDAYRLDASEADTRPAAQPAAPSSTQASPAPSESPLSAFPIAAPQ